MSAKPMLAGLASLSLAFSICLGVGCSSSHPRDINYGTDAGLFYVPPDLGPADQASTTEAGTSMDAQSMDGGDNVDAANDTNN